MLANFDYSKNSRTSVTDILNLAEGEKENVTISNCVQLSSFTLGAIVNDIWNEGVRKVKRGPVNRRQTFYKNLQRKVQVVGIDKEFNIESLDSFVPPLGWNLDKNVKEEFTYLRIEHTHFMNSRQITELTVRMLDCKLVFLLKCHGCSINLKEMHDLEMGGTMRVLSVKEQVSLMLEFISTSSICPGILVPDGEEISAIVPHVFGMYEDRASNTTQMIAYSKKCKIISPPHSKCSACSNLQKIDKNRKKRKIEQKEIKPSTNKRYLTTEEIVSQLKKEQKVKKNAEKREKYWKEKFDKFSVAMEEEDHGDLVNIMKQVKKEDVPEDMECLLNQQKKILSTSSKNGYRWHPK